MPRKITITFDKTGRSKFFTNGTNYSQAVGVLSVGLLTNLEGGINDALLFVALGSSHDAGQDFDDMINLIIGRFATE